MSRCIHAVPLILPPKDLFVSQVPTARSALIGWSPSSRRVRAGLFLGLALLLVAGGIADRSMAESPFGRRGAFPEWQGPITITDLARDSIFDERYGFALALADLAPGADVHADATVWRGFFRENVLSVGQARSAQLADLTGLDFPDGPPTHEGEGMGGWSITVLDGGAAPQTMLARSDEHGRRLVDARLVSDWPEEASVAASPLRPRPGLHSGAIDASILIALLLAGGLVTPRTGRRGVVRVALALVTGVAMQATVGILLIPRLWSLAVVGLIGLGLATALRRRGVATGWRLADVPVLGAAALLVLTISMRVRTTGFTWASPDSITYLSMAKFMGDGLPWRPSFKRQVGQQSIHAPGFALDVEGVHSVGLVILVAALVILAGSRTATGLTRRWALPIGLIVGLGMVANRWVVLMAAYINSHLLVAVMMLALAVLLGLRRDGSERASGSGAAVGFLMAALVVLRPEGPFLAALMLVGTLRRGLPVIAAHWWSLGAATIAWYWALGRPHRVLSGGSLPARIVLVMLALGLAIALVPSIVRRLPVPIRHALPLTLAALLWAATFALLFSGATRITFVDAAVVNLGQGLGRWGLAGPLLMLVGLLVAGLAERASDGPGVLAARWTLIGLIPVLLLSRVGDGLQSSSAGLSVLLSGGGRVGWGDSVNRMWLHAVLLVLLLLIVRSAGVAEEAAEEGADSQSRPRDRWARRPVVHVLVATGVTASALWVASQWDPFYAGGVALPTFGARTPVVATDGVRPLGELTDGSEVRQQVLIDPVLSGSERDGVVRLCVSLTFVTFLRTNDGTVLVDLMMGDVAASGRFRAARLQDWGQETVCLRVGAAALARDVLTVTVTGSGASPGRGVSLLAAQEPHDAARAGLPSAVARDLDGVVGSRVSSAPVVLEVELRDQSIIQRVATRAARVLLISAPAVPVIPWIGVVLVVAIAWTDRWGRRPARVSSAPDIDRQSAGTSRT